MNRDEFESDEVTAYENFIFPISSVEIVKNQAAFDEYVSLKVLGVSTQYESDTEIDLKLGDGSVIGALFVKPLNNKMDFSTITEKKYYAYLTDVTKETFLLNEPVIGYSYVIIHKDYLDDYYKEYYNTSAVWGNFFHKSPLTSNISKSKPTTHITPIKKLKFPTEIHRRNAVKGILEPFIFERFLKKYHQIELSLDLEIVEKITSLKKDLYGIGNLFSELGSAEILRMRIIFKNKIKDYSTIATFLYNVTLYKDLAETIFQKFTKVHNPVKDMKDFNKLLDLPSFSQSDISKFRTNLTGGNYEMFLLEIATYWIYRIRSSIAHQRLGEYIITDKEEDFLLQFAEPLIDQLLLQIYDMN